MKTRNWMLLIALIVIAVPTFAQYEVMRDVAYDDGGGGGGEVWADSYAAGTYLDNPCTAVHDWVYVNYGVDLQQEAFTTKRGTERYIVAENMTMGGTYKASGSSEADVDYMVQPFTVRQYHKVQSTYDNFHVVTVIDYDPASRQSYVTLETACGNGMPDSAQ